MSNRQSVLTALDKHGKSTYAELEFNTGLNREKLRQAVNDAKKAGHIAAGKDDVTGQPAYTLTASGKVWLKQAPAEAPEKIPTTVSNPVVRDSLTTEENLRQQVAHLTDQLAGEKSNLDNLKKQSEENHRLFLAAARDLATINRELHLDPDDGGAEPITIAINDMRDRQEQAEGVVIRWLDLAREYNCKTIPELRAYIADLKALKVAEITIKQPVGFVVSTPNKPLRRFKNHDTAKTQAMSFARNFGTGEVHALYPVGKAVRGAEWKEQA